MLINHHRNCFTKDSGICSVLDYSFTGIFQVQFTGSWNYIVEILIYIVNAIFYNFGLIAVHGFYIDISIPILDWVYFICYCIQLIDTNCQIHSMCCLYLLYSGEYTLPIIIVSWINFSRFQVWPLNSISLEVQGILIFLCRLFETPCLKLLTAF